MMASCRDLLDLYLEGKKIGSSEYGDFATGMVKSISPPRPLWYHEKGKAYLVQWLLPFDLFRCVACCTDCRYADSGIA